MRQRERKVLREPNRRMVFAAFECGTGKEGVAKFCEVFNMPFNMTPDTWSSHVVKQKNFDVMRKAEISSGKHSWKEARRRDSGRIQQAEHRARDKHKQYRLEQRKAKQREDLRVTREGITYGAGSFDKTQMCRSKIRHKQQ